MCVSVEMFGKPSRRHQKLVETCIRSQRIDIRRFPVFETSSGFTEARKSAALLACIHRTPGNVNIKHSKRCIN